MTQPYDWSGFYIALCQHGPDLLVGISDDLREVIRMVSTTSDMFWSDSLEDCLAEGAAAGSLRDGVLLALDQWRINVLDQLDSDFSISLDRNTVSISAHSPMIDRLVDASS